jgi:hypothetical protein
VRGKVLNRFPESGLRETVVGGVELLQIGDRRMPPSNPFASATTTLIAVLTAISSPALAQTGAAPFPGKLRSAEHTAGDILVQPIRDAGLMHVEIPDPLVRASASPYALSDDASCAEVSAEIEGLSAILGPDLVAGPGQRENLFGRLAEAGGRAAVNSLIPFRTLVREVTGAAPAQRRFQEAVELGYARRGFLRGIYRLRDCSADRPAGNEPAGLSLSTTPAALP